MFNVPTGKCIKQESNLQKRRFNLYMKKNNVAAKHQAGYVTNLLYWRFVRAD